MFDRYELGQPIGPDRTAPKVYLARDLLHGRDVALTLVTGPGRAIERFKRELRARERLSHPHFLALLDHGEADEGYFATMELVDALTLGQRIVQLGPIDAGHVRRIGAGLASALAYLHGQGIVHRHVSPANVLLDETGDPYLDFFPPTPSRPGELEGFFFPLEVLNGPAADRHSEKVDIYGLGATLCAALTGRPPVAGPIPEFIQALNRQNPARRVKLPSGVPRDLARTIRTCLEKDPAQRFPCMAAVEAALADGEFLA